MFGGKGCHRRREQTILWSGFVCWSLLRWPWVGTEKNARNVHFYRSASEQTSIGCCFFFPVMMKYIVLAATPTEHFTIIGRHLPHCSWRLAQPELSFELDDSRLIAGFAESVWRNAVMAKANIQKDGTMSTWDAFDFSFPAPPNREASANTENTAKTMTLTTISCQKLKFSIQISIEYCFFRSSLEFSMGTATPFLLSAVCCTHKSHAPSRWGKKGQPILV